MKTRVVGVCFRKCVKASGIRAHVCYDLILIGFDRMGVDRIRVWARVSMDLGEKARSLRSLAFNKSFSKLFFHKFYPFLDQIVIQSVYFNNRFFETGKFPEEKKTNSKTNFSDIVQWHASQNMQFSSIFFVIL